MVGRLRLISGLILFVFVLGHFSNHALGIISLRAMNEGWYYTIEPWRSLPGTILISTALAVHVLLAVWALYSRRTLRLKRAEYVQAVLGFLIPILLASHVVSTRGGHEIYGLEEGYAFILYAQWVDNPVRGIFTTIALLVVWLHACIGWHYWLRLKPWYQKIKVFAFSLALIVPVLAIAGVISGAYRVLRLSRSEKWTARLFKNLEGLVDQYRDFVSANADFVQNGVLTVIGLILLVHLVRWGIASLPGGEMLQFRDMQLVQNREMKIQQGASVLDLLRQADIPHASVCGGRGRCSTCRVRVDDGLDKLMPAGPEELRVLERVGAPPNVRLACQLRPKTSLAVTALLNPDAAAKDGFPKQRSEEGQEQDIAVLFADIRAFTKLSETQLPYDTSFLLNRYFAAMGQAIEGAGGHLDKFIGDGVMALFGIDKPLEQGCREALSAAKAMSEKLEELNKVLKEDMKEPLRIGIGIHSGTAIVGNMGYNRATGLTAIGDVVNTASRLESLSKEFTAQLVVSEKTAELSGFDLSEFPRHETEIRGRSQMLGIRVLNDARELSAKTAQVSET